MRMSNQNRRSDFFEKCRYCICIYININWSDVGHHLPEILVQCLRITGELNTFKIVGPDAYPKSTKPPLLIGCWCDNSFHSAAACISSSRLVDEINPETPSQKNGLIAFPSVGCCFKRLGKLTNSMPHNQRIFARLHGNLVKNISMISMKGLSRRGLIILIESSWIGNHSTANCKASLFLNKYWPFFCAFIIGGTGRK